MPLLPPNQCCDPCQGGSVTVSVPGISGYGTPEGVQIGVQGREYTDLGTGEFYVFVGTNGSKHGWVNTGQLNVQAFGAIPDGSTVNTVAIQAAITSATAKNRQVYFPPGTYLTGALTVTASLTGTGDDTILKTTGTPLITADRVAVKRLKILAKTSTALATTNTLLSYIVIDDLTVDFDPSIVAHDKLSLDSSFTEGIRVSNCRFFHAGLQFTRASHAQVVDNYFDLKWDNINEAIQFSQLSHGLITGNTILNTCTDAIDCFSSGDLCIIANNTIDGVGDKTLAVGQNLNETCITLKVSFIDGGGGNGSSGPTLGWVHKTMVVGNIIRNFNPTSTGNRWFGIQAKWDEARAIPVWDLTQAVRNIIIANNIFDGFWTTNPNGFATAYYAGVHFDGYGAVIHGNEWMDISNQADGGTASQTCAVELGFFTPAIGITATGCVISGNIYRGDGTGVIVYSATHCVIANNIVQKDYENNRNPRYGMICYGALTQSQITGNNFDLTFANPFAVTLITPAVWTQNIISGNVALAGWDLEQAVDHCTFSSNVMGQFLLGLDGTEKSGNVILGNQITSASNGVTLFSQSSFVISSNSFNNCTGAIKLDGSGSTIRTHHGVIKNNVSLADGAALITFSNMSAPTQATVIVSDNMWNGALASSSGTVNLGGNVNIAGYMLAGTTSPIGFASKGVIYPGGDGIFTLFNDANTNFNLLQFGGQTASFPAIHRNAASLEVKLADSSARTSLWATTLNLNTVPIFANNAAAVGGGLAAGDLYRTNANPDPVCIVH